jgi:hypothetical protein
MEAILQHGLWEISTPRILLDGAELVESPDDWDTWTGKYLCIARDHAPKIGDVLDAGLPNMRVDSVRTRATGEYVEAAVTMRGFAGATDTWRARVAVQPRYDETEERVVPDPVLTILTWETADRSNQIGSGQMPNGAPEIASGLPAGWPTVYLEMLVRGVEQRKIGDRWLTTWTYSKLWIDRDPAP